MSVLVDSDVLIEASRGRDADLVSRWIELSRSDAPDLYSPVGAAEFCTGARPTEQVAIEDLFRALTCVPIDAKTARELSRPIPAPKCRLLCA